MLEVLWSGLIDFVSSWMLSGASVTAGTNAAWGASGLLLACGFHLVRHYGWGELTAELREALGWGRLPGICLACHRTFWNLAIWTAPPGAAHGLWADTWRWALLPLILGMIYGSYRVGIVFVPAAWRKKVLTVSLIFVCVSILIAVWLTPAHHAAGYNYMISPNLPEAD